MDRRAHAAAKTDAVVSGRTPDVLSAIYCPHTEIAVWQRGLAQGVCAELATGWPAGCVRFTCARKDSDAAIADMFYGHPALAADVADLCQRFAGLFEAPGLHIRLETVTGDACRKFHVDHVRARLVTTYMGPGSEWGYTENGEPPRTVQRLSTGDAAMFKGRLFPGYEGSRVLHRSPPIAGQGIERYVLCVDMAEGSFAPDADDQGQTFAVNDFCKRSNKPVAAS